MTRVVSCSGGRSRSNRNLGVELNETAQWVKTLVARPDKQPEFNPWDSRGRKNQLP